MAYKFATGSVRRGDIYNEDDTQGNTYLDWNEDALGVVAGGTTVFVVSGSTALVGIGLSNPSQPLHVSGNLRVEDGYVSASAALYGTDLVLATNSDSSQTTIYLEGGSGTEILSTGGGNLNITAQDGSLYLYASSSGDVIGFGTNGNASRVVIDEDGNMGIGTTEPDYTLDVQGYISVGSAGTAYIINNNDTDTHIKLGGGGTPGVDGMVFTCGGKAMLTLDENGLDTVSIGTTGDATDFKVMTTNTDYTLYVSGGVDGVGICTSAPAVSLDIHYTGSGNPVNLSNDEGGGEVVYFGTSSAGLVAGGIYYLNTGGGWQSVDSATTGNGHNQLLGVSLGTKASNDGMLIKGYFDIETFYSGSFIKGAPMYIQSSSASRAATAGGYLSGAAPTAGNSYVRVVGYGTDTANVIYFNPDSTYVEIA